MKKRAKTKIQRMVDDELGLSGHYYPASEACTILDTVVPDSMDYEAHIAIRKIKHIVGGSLYKYVLKKLQYTDTELCKSLSAEQIDAVALAIYNIEEKEQGMIIGDQTGIGKGRVAAAMIRYAHLQGLQPIFLSEKPNLFSDIYRDLAAIGSAELEPFIVNGKESKTDVKDENGNVIYQALPPTEQNNIFVSAKVPKKYKYIMGTYSQFNSLDRNVKPDFLLEIAKGNILIMDEAHNASGSSNTGEFLQKVIASTKGVVFLSATFAKRPDNMPIYAMKTAMSDCNLTKESLVEAIISGGVALQEVLSAQLVAEGQMIRRERSFEGIEVNYITLDEKEQEHKAISDNITDILRDIIEFQDKQLMPEIEEMDKIAAAEGKEMELRKGTSKAGVDSTPYFSKVFNVINQMLFSIKAESVAERAIQRLKEGKKPIIAFASTMGSFLETMDNENGLPLSNGDVINADFKTVLMRGLESVLRFTEKDVNGKSNYKRFDIAQLNKEAQEEYYRIVEKISTVSTGITISPIDKIIQKIQEAGYTVAEVTGRKLEVQFKREQSTDDALGLGDIGRIYHIGDTYYENGMLDGSKRKVILIGDVDSDYIRAFSETEKAEIRIDRKQLDEFYEQFPIDNIKLPINIPVIEKQPIVKKKTVNTMGVVYIRKRENVNDAFRRFNNNEVDCLLINQSGSTGASAHAIVTDKVPANEVKQRVMVILQPELNINTEVQKRGRINRTGQIYKPIYDYISSAIPAEKRIMMMLQQKLKSLDANTTSNQKQSSKLLMTDDFLNKFGDKVVAEYTFENKEFNEKIGDPLGFNKDNKEGKSIAEDAAQKVSGRVAVLSTTEQARFYKDIVERYNDFIEYLKDIDEYDLETEIMNLDAEIIEEKAIILGKGGTSPFGADSIQEKCRVNILKKPFSKIELDNLLRESLQGNDAMEIQKEQTNKLTHFMRNKALEEIADSNKHYEKLITEITNEKGYKKIPQENEGLRLQYISDREKELNKAKEDQKKEIERVSNNKYSYLKNMFDFFHIGKSVNFPKHSYDMGDIQVPSVFLGFVIDQRKANPYAPSAIKARFAISDTQKYLSLTLSGEQADIIRGIIGASHQLKDYGKYIREWEAHIKSSSADRGIRYIITGNLLQAAADYRGKLISYTTIDGATKKGILMPENWDEKSKVSGSEYVVVPISKASVYIQSLMVGHSIHISDKAGFARTNNGFKFFVPQTKLYKAVYEDEDIRALAENKRDGFIMVSGNMDAMFDEKNIPKLVEILQEKFNYSVNMPRTIYDVLVKSKTITAEVNHKKDVLTQEAENDLIHDKEAFEKRLAEKAAKQIQPPSTNSESNILLLKFKLMRLKLELLEL